MKPSSQPDMPIGERLRQRRIEVLGRGLRESAKLLGIAPAHLTDIEKGRRSPSDELLVRFASVYEIGESELRAGWGKAQADVAAIAASSPVNAEKAPELLRAAKDLDAKQWDALIEQARALAASKSKKPRKDRKR